jgi:flagellar hook-basal body complex protein FliE
MAIGPVALERVAAAVESAARAKPAAGGGSPATAFADTVSALVEGVEKQTAQANAAVTGMLDKSVDVHDAMIALQKSELALQLTVQIRNKFVQAYQDVMRMPV